MPVPTLPTDPIFPDWTNLVDTWREEDAEWLRNRSVLIFPSAGDRDTVMNDPGVTKSFGMMSIVGDSAVGGPDFWTGTAWESVRYPHVIVTPITGPPLGVRLAYQGTGSGIVLDANGLASMAKAFVGSTPTGVGMDATGLTIQVGRPVKLATNANALTVDSPVEIAGGLTVNGQVVVNGALQLNASPIINGNLTVNGINAQSMQVNTLNVLSQLFAGDLIIQGSTIKNRAGAGSVAVNADSTVRVNAAQFDVVAPATFQGSLYAYGQVAFPGGRPQWGTPLVGVAGLIVAQGNVAPTQAAPDGTLYVTY